MRLRYHGFRELGILTGATFPYVLKPLLAGAVPPSIQHFVKKQIRQPGEHTQKGGKRPHGISKTG